MKPAMSPAVRYRPTAMPRKLAGATSPRYVLPDGPPSYEGPIVKVRWRVRLRLRYADGGEVLDERPFSLGPAVS